MMTLRPQGLVVSENVFWHLGQEAQDTDHAANNLARDNWVDEYN
jgi:predicted O-methyltransferase YrrM